MTGSIFKEERLGCGESDLSQSRTTFIILTASSFITDSKKALRVAAVKAIATISGDEAFAHLINALNDTHIKVQFAAVEGLFILKRPDALPHLAKLLSHKNEDLRMKIVTAIGQIDDVKAVKPLSAVLQDKKVNIRMAVLEALARYGEPAQEAVIPAVKDRNSSVRVEAANVLRRLGNEDALSALGEILSDSELKVRIAAVSAIGIIGGEKSVELLMRACDDKHPVVREYACGILGAWGDPRAIPALHDVLQNDPEQDVRIAAASALTEIGDSISLRVLNEMISISEEGEKDTFIESAVNLIRQHHEKKKSPPEVSQKKTEPSGTKDKKTKTVEVMKIHYRKAVKHFKKGEYEQAIKEWKKIIEFNPHHEQSKRMIKRAEKKLQSP